MKLSKLGLVSATAFALGLAAGRAEDAAPAPKPSAPAASAPSPAPQAVAPKPSPTPQAAAPAPAPTPAAAATPAAAPSPAAGDALAPAPIPTEVVQKPKPKSKPAPPPLETALSKDPHPTLSPETFFATQKAAERYARIVEEGGWATDLPALRPGSKGEAVVKLRRHLVLEGDLDAAEEHAKTWNATLTAAVKHFQARMGLRQTGVVAGATLKAINVPAETRRQQLAASAARLSNLHFDFEKRYVVVNLPSTTVEAVQDGQVAHRYVAIVGDPDHASPEISAHISVVNLNPTWTVPTSIIKKEIIPHMQRDPGYLTRMKIRVLDGQLKEIDPRSIDWSTERAASYILRQDSGVGNSLGSIRIGMPNKLAVYMHDTPGKALFGRDFRFLSHGCVRVQGVYDYAAWLLEETPGPTGAWDKAALLEKQKSKERFDIKLSHPVPVIWVYLTGWSNEDGVVNFRTDVYGVDPAAEANAAAAANDAVAIEPAAVGAPVAPRPVAPPPPPPPPSPEATPFNATSILDFLRSNR